MSKRSMIGAFVGALFLSLLALPVHAGMTGMTDSDLAGISGKANSVTMSSTSTLAQDLTAANGVIHVGYLQWNDTHAADASDHKGANDQSGSASTVQATVTGEVNVIQWGALANTVSSVGDISGATSIDSEAWATMYLGGF